MITKEKFQELYTMDVSSQIEKTYQGLSYLSWATAYKLMMEADNEAEWGVYEDNGIPFFASGELYFVKTWVKMFGVTKNMWLPVMDNKHKAISLPDARHINDNIMRCLAKNIALFGIGLSLYTGEDIVQYREADKQPVSSFTTASKPVSLTREEMIKKYDELEATKRNSYDEEYRKRENKIAKVPAKFIKKDFLEYVAGVEKW